MGFSQLKDQLYANPWVVYSKTPFGGPEQVLDYLGRYTHRVAISNHRITNVQDGSVSFTYRDRRDNDKVKLMTLHAHEFIRRFLLHVLPSDFVRIRHFGFLANRSKATKLPIIRQLLGLSPHVPRPEKTTPQELILLLTGIDLTLCPSCRTGTMTVIRKIPKYPTMLLNNLPDQPQILDSS